jgi:hypothetical protein
MKILTPLRTDYIDGRKWLLARTFAVDFEGEHGLDRIYVPRGFVTDFNSIPRIFWRIAPPTEYGEAAVIHDYLYRTNSNPVVPRDVADNAHRTLMKFKKASWIRHSSYFRALRMFAGGAYHTKTVDGTPVKK